ncbi:MAG: DNA-binding protein [Microcystaceae cyanobacterium]
MKEYDFTLTFKLTDPHVNSEIYVEALYDAGCDDALLSTGKRGYLAVNFIRESSSAFEAISSANSNVKSVLTEAELIHVSPDLVGIKELTDIFQCSPQNMQQFVSQLTFPNPVYKGSQTIWHLKSVLHWFAKQDHEINQELLEVSELAMSINLRIENQTTQPQTSLQAKRLVLA